MACGHRVVALLSPFVVAVAVCGCNAKSTSMTSPDVAAPAITSVTPAPLHPSPAPQALRIAGAEFQPGLALLVTPPSGEAFAVSGQNIQNVDTSSFDASVVASQPGMYTFVAENDDGNVSAPYSVAIGTGQSLVPAIASLTPSSISAGPHPTTLTFQGTNLLAGLSLTFAGPSAITIQGAPVVANSTTVTVVIIAATPGQYSASVLNPGGALSNSVSLVVN